MFEELKEQFEQHIKTAYTLLPDSLIPYASDAKVAVHAERHLHKSYEQADWEQVLVLLKNYCKTNRFSPELQAEIESAEHSRLQYESLALQNSLVKLSENDLRVIQECLQAAVFGPFFPEYEFTALFGLEREEVAKVAWAWPFVDVNDEKVGIAINNSMNWLLAFPHKKFNQWSNFVSVSPEESYKVYKRWRILSGREDNQNHGNAEFFKNIE